ncbi:MAG: co-chaperone DjlA [Steroidobacteraceae bacterium]
MAVGMKWIGKALGALLGALAAGPVGAAIGVLLGHQFDVHAEADEALPPAEVAGIAASFFRATFRVMGYLAKADGRVSPLAIAAARGVLAELRLTPAQVREAIACFTEGKQPYFDVGAELGALHQACHGRPDLMRVFLEIQVRAALAGNDLEGPVRPLMSRVAGTLRVSPLELAHIEAVLRIQRAGFQGGERPERTAARGADLSAAYQVLETPPGASDEEIVKAYRRQLSRHHPDKLKANGLPESMLSHAKQRTQQIIEAYELIRARRGLS